MTDLHFHNYPFSSEDEKSIVNIHKTIRTARPDLIVLTGDIIFSPEVPDPDLTIQKIAEIFNQYEIPIALTYGNHDSEKYVLRIELLHLENHFKHLVQKKNKMLVNDKLFYNIEIKNSNEELIHIIYLIDSGDYAKEDNIFYDYIEPEHVAWLNTVNLKYSKAATNVCFTHIPLIEYEEAKDNIIKGRNNEDISSSEINSGLFSVMLKHQNLKAVFCGHDHDNDFAADHLNKILAYGRVSGYNCYGDLPRGARLIDLDQNNDIKTTVIEYDS
ncbi:metallophosphoesterase family protein [Salinicoccus sp. YB14-2]